MADFIPLRSGISRRPLARDPKRGLQMDLIRIDPGFTDAPHLHDDVEWVYVLEGGFEDQRGRHQAGDFLINTAEGVHQVKTGKEGCLLLIVWCGSVTPVGDAP